jgi:hypothetical protein
MEDCHDIHTPLTAAGTDWKFFFLSLTDNFPKTACNADKM